MYCCIVCVLTFVFCFTELRAEITRLRGQGFTTPTRSRLPSQNTPKDVEKIAHTEAIKESLAEIAELRRKLTESEHHMKEAEGSWKQRLKESEMRRVNEIREMEVGLGVDLVARMGGGGPQRLKL